VWGNLVISVTGLDGRVIATDKESGKIVWDKKLLDQAGLEITAAPLALKDSIIIERRAVTTARALDRFARCEDRRFAMEDLRRPGAPASG